MCADEEGAADAAVVVQRDGVGGDRVDDAREQEVFHPQNSRGQRRGILVPSPDTPAADVMRAHAEFLISTTLGAAVDRMFAHWRWTPG